MMEREPDLIFVKEEMFDDYPIGQQRLTDNRKSKCILKRHQTQVIIPSCVCVLVYSGSLFNSCWDV